MARFEPRAAAAYQERRAPALSPIALAASTADPPETEYSAEHAGIRAHSALERSQFHTWLDRRRKIHAPRPQPHAPRRRPRCANVVNLLWKAMARAAGRGKSNH